MKAGIVRVCCLFAAIGILAIPRTVQARLGETRDKCNERYGEAVRVEKLHGIRSNITEVRYEKNGIRVWCAFDDGRCVHIMFNVNKDLSLLPLEKAVDLIKLNAQDAKWSKMYKFQGVMDNTYIGWSRSDGGWATYTGDPTNGFFELNIYSPAWDNDDAAKHKKIYQDMSQSGDTSSF